MGLGNAINEIELNVLYLIKENFCVDLEYIRGDNAP